MFRVLRMTSTALSISCYSYSQFWISI